MHPPAKQRWRTRRHPSTAHTLLPAASTQSSLQPHFAVACRARAHLCKLADEPATNFGTLLRRLAQAAADLARLPCLEAAALAAGSGLGDSCTKHADMDLAILWFCSQPAASSLNTTCTHLLSRNGVPADTCQLHTRCCLQPAAASACKLTPQWHAGPVPTCTGLLVNPPPVLGRCCACRCWLPCSPAAALGSLLYL